MFKKRMLASANRRLLSIPLCMTALSFMTSVCASANVVAGVEVREMVNTIQQQQRRPVKGTIVDRKGEPVIGANVVEKGTTNGTITDVNGFFDLSVHPDAVLVISYIGYTKQEIPVKGERAVNVTLLDDSETLDEVVVVGYGSQRKSSLTAAVTTVDTKAIENVPRPNIVSSLQGRVAGLTINENSGDPTSKPSILVRGIGTIDGGTAPLVIIDGVPNGNIDQVSSYDVESISVLKDAAAAAIYGAKAANGVILVTTKSGKMNEEKPIVSFNSYVGFQTLAQIPKALTAYEYASLKNEILKNDGNPTVFSEKDLQMFKNGEVDDFHGNTDWKKEVMRDMAPLFNNHLSVTGNGKIGRYYLSGEFVNQKGFCRFVGKHDRMNLRANVTSDITKKIQLQFMSNYVRTHGNAGDLSYMFGQVLKCPPVAKVRYSNGEWGGGIYANGYGLMGAFNPVARMQDEYGPNDNYWNTLNATGSLQYKPIDGLTLKGLVSYRNSWADSQSYGRSWRTWDLLTGVVSTGPAMMSEKWDKEVNYLYEASAMYEKQLDKHAFKIFAAASFESQRDDHISAFRKNFINDDLYELNAGDASSQTNNGNADQWAYASFFGRANYSFEDKYLFETNLRYDGSSRFAPDSRWGLFPSVSLGWNLSKESFLNKYDFIDNLKLRLSWGQLGNAEKVGLYQWYAGINSGSYYNFDNTLVFGTRPGSFANTDLTWETTTTYNVGLDGSLWSGKLSFEADFWKKNTDNILLSMPVSTVIGLPGSTLTMNTGKVSSTGFDLTIGSRGNITKDLSYNAALTFTAWNSWVVDLEDRATPFSTEFRPHEELGNIYGYECLGIINDDATLNEYRKKENVDPRTSLGDLQFKDQNGDGRLDYLDYVKIGNSYTKNNLGLNIGLNYKGFDFQAFLQGAFNVDKEMTGLARSGFGSLNESPVANMLDRWTEENRNADALYPRLRSDYSFNTSPRSSFFMKNGSYMKLKNLQIGYNIPQPLLAKINVKSLRLYVSGTNLFTIAPGFLSGFDPEGNMDPAIYPTLRVYSVGLNLSF